MSIISVTGIGIAGGVVDGIGHSIEFVVSAESALLIVRTIKSLVETVPALMTLVHIL